MKKFSILLIVAMMVISVTGLHAQPISPYAALYSTNNGGARILEAQGNTAAHPAIGFHSAASNKNIANDDGGGGNGIFRPAANVMAFATSSTERMRISPGGNVGIGTFNQTLIHKLQIDGGNVLIRGKANFAANGDEAYLYLGDQNHYIKSTYGSGVTINTFGVSNGIFLQQSTGNVGIGTATPEQKLNVHDGIIQVTGSNVGGGPMIIWGPTSSAGSNNETWGIETTPTGFNFWRPWNGQANPGNNFLFLEHLTGNVGIGTPTPREKLDVEGNIYSSGIITVGGPDLVLGINDVRPQGIHTAQRALVHGSVVVGAFDDDVLYINYAGDFEGGVQVGGGKTVFNGGVGIGTTATAGTNLSVEGENKSGINSLTNHNVDWGYNIRAEVNRANTKALAVQNIVTHTENFVVYGNGRTTIGTPHPNISSMLSVDGTIVAKEVIVTTDNWPDFVFDKNYKLMPLEEVEQYIKANKHLPGIAPASEYKTKGIALAEMSKLQMEKIEQLTLYMIEQKNTIEKLRTENEQIKKQFAELISKINIK